MGGTPSLIFFEDKDGLCCRPADEITSITPAFPHRLRIETGDGLLGYCYQAHPVQFSGPCPESFDPQHLRRLETSGKGLLLTLASGQKLAVAPARVEGLRHFLQLDRYQPQPESLTRLFLREYPFEIARAPAPVLQAHFPSPRHLIAALLWQTLERIRTGLGPYGDDHPGYFYKPLYATLERAGFLTQQFSKSAAQELFQRVLSRMVRDDRLFDYRDLGFVDHFAHQREIGSIRPDILLVIERDCLTQAGIAAARQCGISWVVTAGIARVITVEFFCAALHQVYRGPVLVVDYGDFDPGGWLNGRVFVQHLDRYDTPCPKGPHYLVRPELYTQEEIDLFSRPLSSKDGRVEEWLAESGGIAGQARGIHADWLHPAERVHQALQNLLRQLPFRGGE